MKNGLKAFFRKHPGLAQRIYRLADAGEKQQTKHKDARSARQTKQKDAEQPEQAREKKNKRTVPWKPISIGAGILAVLGCIVGTFLWVQQQREPVAAEEPVVLLGSLQENSTEQKVMEDTYGVVYVDGMAVASLSTFEQAQEVAAGVIAHYQTAGSQLLTCEMPEAIEARAVIGAPWNPVSVDAAVSIIVNGTEEPKTYTVVKGDTMYGIAGKVGMTYNQLAAMNPTVTPNKLSIGQKLNIVEIKPMVHVAISERVTVTEYVSYGITYESNSSMYIGTTKLKSAGKKGTNAVTYELTSENGKQTSKKKIETVSMTKPVNQVTYKGSKALPVVYGTGVFRYPLDRAMKINSAYGIYRGATLGTHGGVDLYATQGENILAADDGVVTQSGNYGTYGNMVLLDHGNGYQTLYAHASKLLVSVGDTVKKGDTLALVGSTGRSTGPHLHFEVRVNGVKKNPVNYLP